jgi:hypothetical protein
MSYGESNISMSYSEETFKMGSKCLESFLCLESVLNVAFRASF